MHTRKFSPEIENCKTTYMFPKLAHVTFKTLATQTAHQDFSACSQTEARINGLNYKQANNMAIWPQRVCISQAPATVASLRPSHHLCPIQVLSAHKSVICLRSVGWSPSSSPPLVEFHREAQLSVLAVGFRRGR